MLIVPTPLIAVFVLVIAQLTPVAGLLGSKLVGTNEDSATVYPELSTVQAVMLFVGVERGIIKIFLKLVIVIEVRPIGTERGKETGALLYCAAEKLNIADVKLNRKLV